jgi:hypothetical protein
MADVLNNSVYSLTGIDLAGLVATFSSDDIVLTDATYALEIYKLDGALQVVTEGGAEVISTKTRKLPPLSATPNLTLTVGSGITVDTNTATLQELTFTITAAQLTTLLGSGTSAAYRYFWQITPSGGATQARPLGGGYDGVFGLVAPGYGIEFV